MSEPRDFLLQKLPEIEDLIDSICRRRGMDPDAREEFAAIVKLRLVEDDYIVIRAFQHRSSFSVYIAAVIKRLLLDHRNREWGKWRASAEAERLGPVAVDLERLLYRDRRPMDEALVVLARTHTGVTRAEAERLEARLPPRVRRVKVDVEAAVDVIARETMCGPQHEGMARQISAVIRAFIARLPKEDQLLLQLRFHSGMTVAQIARSLHTKQQSLYRKLYRHIDTLRAELTAAGIDAADVNALIGSDAVVLDFNWKNEDPRPSEPDESAVGVRQEESS
ncbi:MAG TPA: sigma-70 family RNA polymerase sigma factor [Thermoanaerobaculia bacterium]|nr:sigma-70 family RNA polymerase sigma factor [Thermoanaerobaculia bacterium]